jgi:SAM-dependent methyltransferase
MNQILKVCSCGLATCRYCAPGGPLDTREPQYAACLREAPVALGPMTGASWRWNPRRLGMMLARYKFVAKMLCGLGDVAEIGCSDGFGSTVVAREVGRLALFDFDSVFVDYVEANLDMIGADQVAVHDILSGPLPPRRRSPDPLAVRYDGIYMLDVLEHIRPVDEAHALANIVASLQPDGVFIAGVPSLESQAYASDISKAGHVNCKTGDELRLTAQRFFRNVFLFGMNDEVLHTGFAPMCQYLFVLCTGPIRGAGRD